MTGTKKRKGDKASQATSDEAAQRQNLRCEEYTDPKSGAKYYFVGNLLLLQEPLLGLIASRECPASKFIETLEKVPSWAKAGRVLVSGFHSPLEQQVLRSLLRRSGRAVKVLAHGMTQYHPEPDEYDSMALGHFLAISALPPSARFTTRESALECNRLVTAIAADLTIPHVSENSPLTDLIAELRNEGRCVDGV